MSDLWPGLNGPAIRYISEAPSEAWRRGVRQLVLLGSTGSIGGNTLAAIRSRRRECVVLGLSCARNIKTLAEQKDSLDEATLEQARQIHRHAQFYWDYVMVENSEGAHNPGLAQENLDKCEDELKAGYALLNMAY